MTREEEIKETYKDYMDNGGILQSNPWFAFKAGAEWADEHPNLESLWHDASKFPNKALPIIVEIYDDIDPCYEVISIDETDEKFWEYLVSDRDITRWAYVSDLLPKGGER